jgi:hypothetical protein
MAWSAEYLYVNPITAVKIYFTADRELNSAPPMYDGD